MLPCSYVEVLTTRCTLEVVVTKLPRLMTLAPQTDVIVNLSYYVRVQESKESQGVIESFMVHELP